MELYLVPLIDPLLKGIFGSGTGKGLRLPGTGGGKKVSWTDQLAEELYKPVKRWFPTRRIRVGGVDDTWSADLVDIQSFSKNVTTESSIFSTSSMCSARTRGLFRWYKTDKNIVRAFDAIPKRKPSRLWVDRSGEFYNRTMDYWLKDNDIEKYSTYNEGEAVVVERSNRTLKTSMWKKTCRPITPMGT